MNNITSPLLPTEKEIETECNKRFNSQFSHFCINPTGRKWFIKGVRWVCDRIEAHIKKNSAVRTPDPVAMLDKFITEHPEEVENIMKEVDKLNIEGPSAEDFIKSGFGFNQNEILVRELQLEVDSLVDLLQTSIDLMPSSREFTDHGQEKYDHIVETLIKYKKSKYEKSQGKGI